jgi:ferric-dicitrate binding protein FerR (iron transport regulator)
MPSPDRVALAQEKLAARARRIRRIRRRVVASVLAAFVLAWGVVAFDGSMGTNTTVASTATTTSTDSTASTGSTAATDTSSSSDSGDDTAPMTTSQS